MGQPHHGTETVWVGMNVREKCDGGGLFQPGQEAVGPSRSVGYAGIVMTAVGCLAISYRIGAATRHGFIPLYRVLRRAAIVARSPASLINGATGPAPNPQAGDRP